MRVQLRRAVALAVIAMAGNAGAAELQQIGKIAVPGSPLGTYDISFWDSSTNRYYLADQTNKSLDIFDGATDTFISRVPGFAGQQKSSDTSGPDGVQIIGDQAWVGDGDSTLKIIDLKGNKVVKLPGGNPHSVAVNESNGRVYLPLGAKGGGCIAVFAAK